MLQGLYENSDHSWMEWLLWEAVQETSSSAPRSERRKGLEGGSARLVVNFFFFFK